MDVVPNGTKFLVQWQDPYFVVCSNLNGRIKQCTVTLKDLESCKFTHCRLFSRLYRKCFPQKLSAALALESIRLFDIIANEELTWLFHSDTLYRLHLSPLSASVLPMAVKSCSQPGSQAIPRQKAIYISTIIDHLFSERSRYLLACRAKSSATPRDDLCSFIERMEHLYEPDVAALLREALFTIGPQVNQESICSNKSLWFNETVDELVRRLHSFSMESILTHIKRIPAHRRPAYNSKSVRKTSNSLTDHILRRVSYLFDLAALWAHFPYLKGARVAAPDVRDGNGHLIHPSEYRTKLQAHHLKPVLLKCTCACKWLAVLVLLNSIPDSPFS